MRCTRMRRVFALSAVDRSVFLSLSSPLSLKTKKRKLNVPSAELVLSFHVNGSVDKLEGGRGEEGGGRDESR